MNTQNKDGVVQVYLFFNGCCEEAVGFYRQALGAEVEMMLRFNEAPDQPPPGMLPPGFDNKIMHCSFRVGQTTVMASDGCSEGKPSFEGFSLSLTLRTAEETDRVFAALADGGQIEMPLNKTFWSPRFGMVKDQFGVGWMVSVAPEEGK